MNTADAQRELGRFEESYGEMAAALQKLRPLLQGEALRVLAEVRVPLMGMRSAVSSVRQIVLAEGRVPVDATTKAPVQLIDGKMRAAGDHTLDPDEGFSAAVAEAAALPGMGQVGASFQVNQQGGGEF
jgi:hypothetical protein